MENMEPKKLALIRILQILKEYSDCSHPLRQEDILRLLERDYGISLERKAIGRNLSLLKEAGFEIESGPSGSYLAERIFEDSELHLLIDAVLSSRCINPRYTAEIIDKLCSLSNRYFKSHVRNIYSVNDWNKSDNQGLFYNIELIDEAIDTGKQIHFDYSKYGSDMELHRSSSMYLSPYLLVLHSQRYYLLGLNEKYQDMIFLRLDRISDMKITDEASTDIRSIPGYENGIDYNVLSCARPYMYTDKPEQVEFIADKFIIDQIIDWFGKDIKVRPAGAGRLRVSLLASPYAMEHWAMQYGLYIEVIKPDSLRQKLRENLRKAADKYKEEKNG